MGCFWLWIVQSMFQKQKSQYFHLSTKDLPAFDEDEVCYIVCLLACLASIALRVHVYSHIHTNIYLQIWLIIHKAWIEIYLQNTCTFLIGLLAFVFQIDFLRVATGVPTAHKNWYIIIVLSVSCLLKWLFKRVTSNN